MTLKIWRFITLLFVALFMGLEFAHALELPAKMQYSGSLYVTIQNSLYGYFGWPAPGAFITLGAVLSACILTFLVHKNRHAFYWTLTGTICLILAFPVFFFLFIEPVNQVIQQSTPETIPANWRALRNQWEYIHLTNFILTLLGFCALLISLFVDRPARLTQSS
jgi:hypothetical protein